MHLQSSEAFAQKRKVTTMKIQITLALIAILSASCSTLRTPTQPSLPQSEFSFFVMGDSPYTKVDEEMLRKVTPIVKASDAPFVIHIGDYKGGGTECTNSYDDQHDILISNLSPKPVFYTPGDNEWTDCDRNINDVTGKEYSELDRLAKLRKTKFRTLPNGTAILNAKRQSSQVENVTWRYNNVRFATLHVVGTNNGRDQVRGDKLSAAKRAVDLRDRSNSDWLHRVFKRANRESASALVIALHGDITDTDDKPEDLMCTDVSASEEHACDAFTDLRHSIRDHSIKFGKPVLVIHGDTDPFTLDQKFAGEEAENLWRLNAAGDAGPGYGVSDITEVLVRLGEPSPFSAKGVMTGKFPATEN